MARRPKAGPVARPASEFGFQPKFSLFSLLPCSSLYTFCLVPASVIQNFFKVVSTGAYGPVGTVPVLLPGGSPPEWVGSVRLEANPFGVLSKTYTISSMVKGQRYPGASHPPGRALYVHHTPHHMTKTTHTITLRSNEEAGTVELITETETETSMTSHSMFLTVEQLKKLLYDGHLAMEIYTK